MTIEHDKYSIASFSERDIYIIEKVFTFSSYTLRRQMDRAIRKVEGNALLEKIDSGAGKIMKSFGLADIRRKRRHVANVFFKAKYHTNTEDLEFSGADAIRMIITGGKFSKLEGMVRNDKAKNIIRRYARYLLHFHTKTDGQKRFSDDDIENIVLEKFIGKRKDNEIARSYGIEGIRSGNSVRKLMKSLSDTDRDQLGILAHLDALNVRLNMR